MRILNNNLNFISNDTMRAFATKKGRASRQLETEIMLELRDIAGQVVALRKKITANLSSTNNFEGCLTGEVDDYLGTL